MAHPIIDDISLEDLPITRSEFDNSLVQIICYHNSSDSTARFLDDSDIAIYKGYIKQEYRRLLAKLYGDLAVQIGKKVEEYWSTRFYEAIKEQAEAGVVHDFIGHLFTLPDGYYVPKENFGLPTDLPDVEFTDVNDLYAFLESVRISNNTIQIVVQAINTDYPEPGILPQYAPITDQIEIV